MKLKRCLLLLTGYYSASFALSVPFQAFLSPGASLSASYQFAAHQIIFCYNNSTAIGSNIRWPYKGKIHSGQLPILLTYNSNFQGEFADKNGTIVIKNTTSGSLQYVCVFGY